MVQAPDIGCLSMAPWTAHDIGLLQLFALQLARKTKRVREANFGMMKVRATKTRAMKREWTKDKRTEQPKQEQFNCGMKKPKQDRVNKTRMMKSRAIKSRKAVCIISLFQLWFKQAAPEALPDVCRPDGGKVPALGPLPEAGAWPRHPAGRPSLYGGGVQDQEEV